MTTALAKAHAAITRLAENEISVEHAEAHATLDAAVEAARREECDFIVDILEAPGRHVTAWDGGWTDEVARQVIDCVRESRGRAPQASPSPKTGPGGREAIAQGGAHPGDNAQIPTTRRRSHDPR